MNFARSFADKETKAKILDTQDTPSPCAFFDPDTIRLGAAPKAMLKKLRT